MDPERGPASGTASQDQGRELTGRRIVITRSESDNRSLSALLSSLGAIVVEIPLVEVLGPDDGGAGLDRAVASLSAYRWVVLTSVNGVEALDRALGGRRWPPTTTVAPVGPVTAAAATKAGMVVAPSPMVATAEGLIQDFPPPVDGAADRVLAPLAELARPTVVNGLRAKGYEVDRVTAYRTAAPESLRIDAVDGDVVAFFSPSAVDRYVDLVGPGPSGVLPAAACVGPVTAARAEHHGFPSVAAATLPTEAAVVQVIVELSTNR